MFVENVKLSHIENAVYNWYVKDGYETKIKCATMCFLTRSLRSRLGMRAVKRITGLGWPCTVIAVVLALQ